MPQAQSSEPEVLATVPKCHFVNLGLANRNKRLGATRWGPPKCASQN